MKRLSNGKPRTGQTDTWTDPTENVTTPNSRVEQLLNLFIFPKQVTFTFIFRLQKNATISTSDVKYDSAVNTPVVVMVTDCILTGVRSDQREVVDTSRWDNLRQFTPRRTGLLVFVQSRRDTRGRRTQ